jgi:O-antigen ligase
MNNVWVESIISAKNKFSFTLLLFVFVLPAALLLGGAIGAFNPAYGVAVAGGMFMVIIVLLRQDELTLTLILAVHLLVDWYLGLHLVALLMALVLLFAYYFGRSPDRPCVSPRSIWLWILFLTFTIYPAIHGGKLMLYDLASYYPSDIFGAFIMFWLGNIIARNMFVVKHMFQMMTAFAALLAIHTIIQAITGIFLFESASMDVHLNAASNYQMWGTQTSRAVSFFMDPNWNGTFFGMMFFLSLGLFIESKSPSAKIVYLIEMSLMLPALLFTYSTGAWIGFFCGVLTYIIFVGHTRYRVFFVSIIALSAVLIFTVFPTQIALQMQHATGPNEFSLRLAAWQTAIRVIEAFPLFGVGLGYQAYFIRANPYRVPAQFAPLSHPHDSYLEWAAMAGIPVLIIFLLLLAAAFWFAWRNWRQADISMRPLLGGGIAALGALTINSISINGWTLPPLAAYGWLIAGLITSPLLAKNLYQQCISLTNVTVKTEPVEQEKAIDTMETIVR